MPGTEVPGGWKWKTRVGFSGRHDFSLQIEPYWEPRRSAFAAKMQTFYKRSLRKHAL